MKTILRMCFFLLCFETALTVQCVLCQSYKNGDCVHEKQKCTTQPGEMCMIRRTWYSFEYDKPESAESRCMKSCKYDENFSEVLTTLTHCCDFEDFCNDIDLPIMMN